MTKLGSYASDSKAIARNLQCEVHEEASRKRAHAPDLSCAVSDMISENERKENIQQRKGRTRAILTQPTI